VTGHEEECEHEHIVIPMRITADGVDVDLSDITTPALRDALGEVLSHVHRQMVKDEIKRWVTPQIAHEVLSAFGDERATAPSLARLSLITLIRTCHISDDAILTELNSSEDFHGYVLAVCMLAENDNTASGMAVLRQLAGLPTDDDLEEIEQMMMKKGARDG
jgi:hypothetical protein